MTATAAPVVVVANPTAGRGKAGKIIGKVDRLLHEAGLHHEIVLSESAADLEHRVRLAAETGTRTVVALGGDGTVGLAANGLVGTGATLAVVPCGTADDFAGAIGIRSVDGAIRALAGGVTATIDLIEVSAGATSRYFVNVAGCGFDSEVNEAANAMRLNLGGTGTYIAALAKTLSRFTPATFRIDLDGETMEGPHMLVIIGNGTSYGGGMKVTPDASLVDGVADVCLLAALSKPAFLRAFPGVFRGTHVRHPAVTMRRATRISVEADRRVMVYADGERVGPAPVTFTVVPSALPVVVGPNPRAVR